MKLALQKLLFFFSPHLALSLSVKNALCFSDMPISMLKNWFFCICDASLLCGHNAKASWFLSMLGNSTGCGGRKRYLLNGAAGTQCVTVPISQITWHLRALYLPAVLVLLCRIWWAAECSVTILLGFVVLFKAVSKWICWVTTSVQCLLWMVHPTVHRALLLT